MFSLKNPIRKFAIVLCEKGRLDAVLLLAIVASTTTMALSDPFDNPERKPVSEIRDALELSSVVFSSIFIAEVVLKIIAYGLILGYASSCTANLSSCLICLKVSLDQTEILSEGFMEHCGFRDRDPWSAVRFEHVCRESMIV